jgi:hypothetical protein
VAQNERRTHISNSTIVQLNATYLAVVLPAVKLLLLALRPVEAPPPVAGSDCGVPGMRALGVRGVELLKPAQDAVLLSKKRRQCIATPKVERTCDTNARTGSVRIEERQQAAGVLLLAAW